MCKKADGEAGRASASRPRPPATAAPYRIKTLEPKRAIVLERNPLWPGAQPAFDEIHYIVIFDANAAEIAYEAGRDRPHPCCR